LIRGLCVCKAEGADSNQQLTSSAPHQERAWQPPYFRRYAVSDTRKNFTWLRSACSYTMSDSEDSDDSNTAFDVRIEKAEKRLQLERYRKKYRNVWTFITNRWQDSSITTVLKSMEEKWRVYSDDPHRVFYIPFKYLKDMYYVNSKAIDYEDERYLHLHLRQENNEKWTCVCDEEDLKSMRNSLHVDMKDMSDYIEFFEKVAEVNYGRKANAIFVSGGCLDSNMREARNQYGRNAGLINMQLIFNNFSSTSRSDRQLKNKFMNEVSITTNQGTRTSRKLEPPDLYTLVCMKFAHMGICRNYHLPQDIWNNVLPFLFKKQTLENFTERYKVARELEEAENLLRNFRLGYAGHYDWERCQRKLLYDVYKKFMRDLRSKHRKLEEKVHRLLAQMDELLEKFKGLPSGGKIELSHVD